MVDNGWVMWYTPMGTMNHDSIIATTWNKAAFDKLQKWIENCPKKWQKLFTANLQCFANSYYTVVITPDGSKEGWDESNLGDVIRERFLKRLEKDEYEDGSSPWEFVEVSFGEYGASIKSTNCKDRY